MTTTSVSLGVVLKPIEVVPALANSTAIDVSNSKGSASGRSSKRRHSNAIRIRLTVALAGCLFANVPAWSFGGSSSSKADYLAMLPANVRKIVAARCGGSAHPHQYFATYLRNSSEIHLHYERLSCDGPTEFCGATGCLHEIYLLHHGEYLLTRSYHGPVD